MNANDNKAAVVTGGARGIGQSIVIALAESRFDVVISDVNLEGAEQVARQVRKMGVNALAVKTDVTNESDVVSLVKEIMAKFGRVDVLVNNAGITRDNLLMRMSEDDWDMVIRVNLKGAFLCTQKIIRPMMKQRSGKIINVASVVGVMGNPGQTNYAASKAGLIGFTKSVAKEVASRNIQVNAIAPGYIETDMTSHLSDEVKANFLLTIPANRPGQPGEVAEVVTFLASSASDYITGQVIHIDGGMVM
ncbi:3-oxoacyl-[acyl-carrier-protein] reductase [bacterium I07]|nr:3-oxoacyl-[acyl-carrier-protein] reductase [bacterium I07]